MNCLHSYLLKERRGTTQECALVHHLHSSPYQRERSLFLLYINTFTHTLCFIPSCLPRTLPFLLNCCFTLSFIFISSLSNKSFSSLATPRAPLQFKKFCRIASLCVHTIMDPSASLQCYYISQESSPASSCHFAISFSNPLQYALHPPNY